LGGKPKEFVPVEGTDADMEESNSSRYHIILYRVGDAEKGNECVLVEETRGAIPKERLDTKHCYVVDTLTEVYVWAGHSCSKHERVEGTRLAEVCNSGCAVFDDNH
jgi:hypothetical protein